MAESSTKSRERVVVRTEVCPAGQRWIRKIDVGATSALYHGKPWFLPLGFHLLPTETCPDHGPGRDLPMKALGPR